MSFSLVAGACCYVEFKNQIVADNSTAGYSLNIHSTGAKYIRYYNKYGYGTSQNTLHYNFAGTSDGGYIAIPVSPGPYFLVFNGSQYCLTNELDLMYYYSDYSD